MNKLYSRIDIYCTDVSLLGTNQVRNITYSKNSEPSGPRTWSFVDDYSCSVFKFITYLLFYYGIISQECDLGSPICIYMCAVNRTEAVLPISTHQEEQLYYGDPSSCENNILSHIFRSRR